VVKTTVSETHDKLKSLGTELGQYHQNIRAEAIGVSGGFCQGAALDWIRRALLGGKYTHVNVENQSDDKNNPTVLHQMRQDRRLVKAQVAITNSQLNAIPNMVKSAGEIKDQGIEAAYNKYRSLYQTIAASDVDEHKQRAMIAQIEKEYKAAKAEAETIHNKRIDQLAALDGRPALQHYWKSYAKVMDEYLAADRLARNKKGASAHAFGSLKPVKSLNSKEWPGGISEFTRTILLDGEFKANRAAYVGVSSPNGGQGHTIALHRLNTGNKFHLFDPNFGVYELVGSKVVEAMVYLFTTHYPNSIGGGNDDHPYQVNGKAWGEYAIFESALPTPKAVTVDPIALDKKSVQAPVSQLKPIATQPSKSQKS